jgi:hypothetical protein
VIGPPAAYSPVPPTCARNLALFTGKDLAMKKLILACIALAFASAIVGGCKAEGEIDPDGHVSHNFVAPR